MSTRPVQEKRSDTAAIARGSILGKLSAFSSDILSLGDPRLDSILALDLARLGQRMIHQPHNDTDDGPYFGALPQEIMVQILSHLDLPDLFR